MLLATRLLPQSKALQWLHNIPLVTLLILLAAVHFSYIDDLVSELVFEGAGDLIFDGDRVVLGRRPGFVDGTLGGV